MTIRCIAGVSLSAVLTASASADVLSTWNLMVFGNHQISSNVEGTVLVRGGISGTGDIGTRLNPSSAFLNSDALLVGGNMTVGNIQMQAGNVRRAGSRSGNINFNGGGTEFVDPGALAVANAAFAEVQGISSFLASQAATGAITIPGSPGPVTLNAVPRPDGVAVFTVDGNSLFSNGNVQQIDINFGGAASVIINVTGSAVSINSANFVGQLADANNASRILWNFHEASTINVQRQVTGAFIAPGANVTNTSTIVGTTAVYNLTQNGQIHIPVYTGYVPAPGAVGLLAGLGLLAARRRR